MSEESMFERLKARGEQVINRVSSELMSNPQFVKAVQGALRGKEMLDQAVARALRSMNVPTRTEFKRALQRIEQLERELATLKAGPARPRARAASASGRSRRQRGPASGSGPA